MYAQVAMPQKNNKNHSPRQTENAIVKEASWKSSLESLMVRLYQTELCQLKEKFISYNEMLSDRLADETLLKRDPDGLLLIHLKALSGVMSVFVLFIQEHAPTQPRHYSIFLNLRHQISVYVMTNMIHNPLWMKQCGISTYLEIFDKYGVYLNHLNNALNLYTACFPPVLTEENGEVSAIEIKNSSAKLPPEILLTKYATEAPELWQPVLNAYNLEQDSKQERALEETQRKIAHNNEHSQQTHLSITASSTLPLTTLDDKVSMDSLF